MAEDAGGTVLLGALLTGAGVLAVDYFFSDPGQSWIDQLTAWAKGEEVPSPDQLADRGLPPPPSDGRRGGPPALPPRAPGMLASPDLVREVQSRINAFHLPSFGAVKMPLDVDGLLGSSTRGAIAALQKQWSMPITGIPDASFLDALRGAARGKAPPQDRLAHPRMPPRRPTRPQGGPPPASITVATVREAASRLSATIGKKLDASGMITPELQSALADFQSKMGLPKTGFPDAQTMARLRSASSSSRVGAAGSSGTPWADETKKLGAYDQSVIDRALQTETPRVLAQLGKLFKDAGFPQTSAAFADAAKKGTTSQATSGRW